MSEANPTKEIVLGNRKFQITPLTIGQLETVMTTIDDATQGGVATKKGFDAHIKVIAAALSVDHSEMTEEEIRKIRLPTFRQLTSAVREIALLSGLEEIKKDAPADAPKDAPKEGDAPGEATAEATKN